MLKREETFEQYKARNKRLMPKNKDKCFFCEGTGRVRHSICDGTGSYRMMGDGIQDSSHCCDNCGSTGRVVCHICKGTGIYHEKNS
jgi:DnaJ-class molecular chaperone